MLTEYQQTRIFGRVVGTVNGDPYCLEVDVHESNLFPYVFDDGLCFVTSFNGEEIACLREYHKASVNNDCIILRIIDEDVRGWKEDELKELLFGADNSNTPYALVVPE